VSSRSAQDKSASSKNLKIGFLMDSLKVERWQSDLDKFQKRASELGADVRIETAEGDDELQKSVPKDKWAK
jgi:D-xylose transport system substrate-binding protein